jgi:DNA mismatch endonuclease (patch repair protein)
VTLSDQTDTFSPDERSRIMRAVQSSGTKPELKVRRIAFALGYRYRLNRKDLPGKPDLVFPGRKKIVFVHGCFWHQHDCPRGSRIPKSNQEYWEKKLSRNVYRDAFNRQQLSCEGWDVLVLWECELRDIETVGRILEAFLNR